VYFFSIRREALLRIPLPFIETIGCPFLARIGDFSAGFLVDNRLLPLLAENPRGSSQNRYLAPRMGNYLSFFSPVSPRNADRARPRIRIELPVRMLLTRKKPNGMLPCFLEFSSFFT